MVESGKAVGRVESRFSEAPTSISLPREAGGLYFGFRVWATIEACLRRAPGAASRSRYVSSTGRPVARRAGAACVRSASAPRNGLRLPGIRRFRSAGGRSSRSGGRKGWGLRGKSGAVREPPVMETTETKGIHSDRATFGFGNPCFVLVEPSHGLWALHWSACCWCRAHNRLREHG